MKLSVFCMGALALSAMNTVNAAPLCSASPEVWCESAVGDAGSFPATSQATKGTGALNGIIGNIGDGTEGSDLYSIMIPNTASFMANLSTYTATGATGESNASIYLFDAQGRGVEAALEGTSLTGFNGTAGLYYIGVVPDGNAPEYKANGSPFAMFGALTNGQVATPVAGASGLDDYSHNGCGASCAGAYEVTLSGAQYSNAPEPGAAGLIGLALAGFGAVKRMRNRR